MIEDVAYSELRFPWAHWKNLTLLVYFLFCTDLQRLPMEVVSEDDLVVLLLTLSLNSFAGC